MCVRSAIEVVHRLMFWLLGRCNDISAAVAGNRQFPWRARQHAIAPYRLDIKQKQQLGLSCPCSRRRCCRLKITQTAVAETGSRPATAHAATPSSRAVGHTGHHRAVLGSRTRPSSRRGVGTRANVLLDCFQRVCGGHVGCRSRPLSHFSVRQRPPVQQCGAGTTLVYYVTATGLCWSLLALFVTTVPTLMCTCFAVLCGVVRVAEFHICRGRCAMLHFLTQRSDSFYVSSAPRCCWHYTACA